MNKILITGTRGFVGSRVAKAMGEHYEVLAPSHRECDITRSEVVEEYVRVHRPHAIVHLAALSNTGYCEQHPEESMRVNVMGVAHMADAAARYGCKLVWFSSDQVYNGNCELGPLSEDIAVCPENHYGRHKLMAEEEALRRCPNSVALRATWMYDIRREGMPTHNNFVLNIEEAIRQHTPLRFATREYRGITWVDEVVRNMPHTLELPGGVYPNTIAGVIYASGQFTPTRSNRVETLAVNGVNETCLQAARAAMAGESPVGGAMHFRRAGNHEGIIIGDHVFW